MERMVCLNDFEDNFKKLVREDVYEYVRTGSADEVTATEDPEAFRRIKILPRVLRDVSDVQMNTTLLGRKVSMPIGVSPSAAQSFVWSGAEVSTFKGIEKAEVCGILSQYSSRPLEDFKNLCPQTPKWLNDSLWVSRDYQRQLLKKAEGCGFSAVVLTVDSPVYVIKRNAQNERPRMLWDCPIFPQGYRTPVDSRGATSFAFPPHFRRKTWADIEWLTSATRLPIVLKGILTPDDASLAVQHGVAAILVSNHGGRQLDTVPATIDVLPGIVEAVKGRAEVYLDGGIRLGTDVFKALALGARAVFIGRPVLWGLAGWGEDGVEKVLNILREELRTTMSLSGCSQLADIKKDLLRRANSKL